MSPTPTPVPDRPPFASLPLDPAGPPGNAWGLYGRDDALGALNMLTPAHVAASAAREIRTGERVSLDWTLDKPSHPSFGRPAFRWQRKVLLDVHGQPRTVNDDTIEFNTQCSSQWDGFRHYGYQKAKRFYGNVTAEQLDGSNVLGLDAWVERGGIVGRGVLLDYAGFCQKHGKTIAPFSSTAITVVELEAVARYQDLELQKGDILLVRSGCTEAYERLSATEQKALADRPAPDFIGIAPTIDTLRWMWDCGFATVAGDAPSFERAPIGGLHTRIGGIWAGEPWEAEMQGGGLLHQWMLAGWGVPIGELFDLEALARKCVELHRWSFFVSSVPLKVPGGVASPPNAIAIF
ncbi:hypothetical protein CMQ_5708 [Grosmannia clavigera kw1407]|uniref:Cyclase n=1 Tax=Grosmannia clavigera (strain kw1407 / UAMH 11150) TaxID=655863 RepID=F0XT50_GROCL|nr:uncharacterized protein CMQ_5708 [Grosmannia clavigera kw1407]EFW99287.1 hypothetical protein CMQ_5708 [Grosmannia clavigera kw1407]